jgi:tetratricopeptide (TPR) repeat protein
MRTYEVGTTLDEQLDALKDSFAARGKTHDAAVGGWLLLGGHEDSAERLLSSFERHVAAAGGNFIQGAWRVGLVRPFGGLLEVVEALAEEVSASQPELLRRYSLTLTNLLPSLRKIETLRKTGELRSGLADFVLHGDRAGLKDFYWKRNVAPLVAADLVHFTLAAATAFAENSGAPTVICLRDVHLADRQTAELLQLLNGYAQGRPLLLCATASELTAPLESWLVKGADSKQAWRIIEPAEVCDADAGDLGPGRFKRLTPEQRQVVQVSSVFVLPFEAGTVESLLSSGRNDTQTAPSASETLESLVATGVLRRFGQARFTFSSPALRESAYRSLDAGSLKLLHAEALEVEGEDSYAALRHAARAELRGEVRRHSIKATERAWAVSDYGSAITTAKQYIEAVNSDSTVSADLLMALLHYEAGQHAETERHLAEALRRSGPDSPHRAVLERLLGYNAIFGLGDFERGRGIMESVLRSFEAQGLQQDAGYVRNTIAYTLFCTRRFDDAVEMERTALKLLESSDQPGGFLFSVLQLNLGRVYRTLGFHDQALRLFKNGLDAPNLEQSPYMLLIFHTTLAQFYATRGEYTEAAAAFHHCLDLARDLELENASDPVLNALSRHVGKLLSERTTRGDEVFFYLYLNLALAYRRMGLNSRSEAYLAGMRGCWGFLDEDVWQAAEAVLDGAAPQAQESGRDTLAEFAEEAAQVERRFEGLTFELTAGAENLVRAVADALAEGKVVALAGPHGYSFGSLVLYDLRKPELAERINAEVGAYGSSRTRTALLLPEALRHFDGGVRLLPLVLQEATLRPSSREELRALAPYGSRVQVLSPEFDGLLFDILRKFAQRTGTGALAALPFHLRGRDLAVTPAKALSAYLVSSIDLLALGERLLAKHWGTTAEQNIMPFRPRLSRNASIFRRKGGEDQDSFLLLVRTWSFHNYLKLRREMRPILDLCDGQRTVAEIVRQLGDGSSPDARLEQQVCAFLRKLARQCAIVYDDPVAGEREAVTSHV